MENNRTMTASQLMRKLSEAMFYMTDLNLYLDTHPNDEKALRMFEEATRNAKACVDAFEKRFYPLFASSADCENDWEWLIGVWPSQIMS